MLISRKYCVIWSYDNFTFEYEENQTEYDSPIDAIKELLEEKKANIEFQKCLDEPKLYLRIRRKEIFSEEPDTEYITDFNMRKYRNRYHLSRAEDIV